MAAHFIETHVHQRDDGVWVGTCSLGVRVTADTEDEAHRAVVAASAKRAAELGREGVERLLGPAGEDPPSEHRRHRVVHQRDVS